MDRLHGTLPVRTLAALGLALAATLCASAPALAARDCGAFKLSARGRSLEGDQSRVVSPRLLPPGSRLAVRGTFVQFDVDLDSFAVIDYTLTGEAAPNQIVTKATNVFKGRAADVDARLTSGLGLATWSVKIGGRVGLVFGEDADAALAKARRENTLVHFP